MLLESDPSDDNKDIEERRADPAPETPADKLGDDYSPADRPVGINELKVVRKIEESIKASRGPRIQIIKSRDIKNAMSFAEKVFRVLKLHGYKLSSLNKENINQKVQANNTDSLTVFTVDERTIKDILGAEASGTERPIRTLFDNSMLTYMKAPVLIVVVSDEFYGHTGLQSYSDSLAQQSTSASSTKKSSRKSTAKPESRRAAVLSMYIAAIAFLASGVNSIFGNYVVIGSPTLSFYPLPTAILLLSIAAIVGRAISLGNEDDRSIPLVVSSILLFIALTLLGLFSGDLPTNVANVLTGTQLLPLYESLPWWIIAFGFAIYLMGVLRYILFLGRGSGRGSYALSIFAVIWITVIVGINLPGSSNGLIVYPALGAGTFQTLAPAFPTDFPIFGFNFSATGLSTTQYMNINNYLVLIGNLIMAVGLLLAAKEQKLLSGSGAKTGKNGQKVSA